MEMDSPQGQDHRLTATDSTLVRTMRPSTPDFAANARRIPTITPSKDNPHAVFNRITTQVVRQKDGWAIVLKLGHDVTGANRTEMSSVRFGSESEARRAGTIIANKMRERLK